MNRPNTPRPFTYVSPPEEEFVLYEDPMPSAAYISTIPNRIIPIGTTAIPRGRPKIFIPNNSLIREELKPKRLPETLPRPAAFHSTPPTIPDYPKLIYYATRQTIMDHIGSLPTTALYIVTENRDFSDNIFYPRPTTPNNGSYFHPGYTVDQIIQMETDRKKEWNVTYPQKKSGGRRVSKRHTRQSKKQHGRKRTTRRR